MLKNYFKIAFRNLARNKTYSAIAIGGIAIGLTALMDRWLEGFAYRIEMQMFGLAGLLAVILAMATISFQSVKAALMNPSKTLRTE